MVSEPDPVEAAVARAVVPVHRWRRDEHRRLHEGHAEEERRDEDATATAVRESVPVEAAVAGEMPTRRASEVPATGESAVRRGMSRRRQGQDDDRDEEPGER